LIKNERSTCGYGSVGSKLVVLQCFEALREFLYIMSTHSNKEEFEPRTVRSYRCQTKEEEETGRGGKEKR
jgi:hypothetical protein